MTVAQSIIRTTFMIKELAAWLEDDIRKNGFSEPGSMSEMDLELAEKTFQHLYHTCHDLRLALLTNRPSLVKEDLPSGHDRRDTSAEQ